MPYYTEYFANRVLDQSLRGASGPQRNTRVVLDSARVTSFRNRPHRKALGKTVIVPDHQADPYAAFLNSTSRKQYRENLNSRGLKANGDPDRGHAFELARHTIHTRPVTWDIHYHGVRNTTNGNSIMYAAPASSTVDPLSYVHKGGYNLLPIPYQETGLDAFAQSAYSRVAPTAEVFDASQFLGELFMGLPRIGVEALQSASGFFRGLGSDYLNVQFGWIPFITDLKNAATALATATRQLQADGKRVHRKYSIPQETTSGFHTGGDLRFGSEVGNISGLLSADAYKAVLQGAEGFSNGGLSPNGAFGQLSKLKRRRRWFEGEFSSFYPLGFDPTDYFQRLDVLVNNEITPETLWNLSPWSWLVDWHLRIGDSIAANQMAANDLLVMHYGYAMEETVYRTGSTVTTKNTPPRFYTYPNYPIHSDTFVTTVYKRRIRANPYGFRVTQQSSLSGGQLAILGALGLTKL